METRDPSDDRLSCRRARLRVLKENFPLAATHAIVTIIRTVMIVPAIMRPTGTDGSTKQKNFINYFFGIAYEEIRNRKFDDERR